MNYTKYFILRYISWVLLMIGSFSARTEHWMNPLRRLIGSDCVYIELGRAPVYSACTDCVVQEGLGCITDMRQNKSQNVGPLCHMLAENDQATECCPRFGIVRGRMDLLYVGSAYPETLRCLINVGCGDNDLYNDLLLECESKCPYPTFSSQQKSNVCFATFNASSKSFDIFTWKILLYIIIVVATLSWR